MRPTKLNIEVEWKGATMRITTEKGYVYVTYAGQRRLLSACTTAIRNKALSLINQAR